MHPLIMAFYNRLPGQTRDFAASVRGAYLGYWRYPPSSEALVAEILERDQWSRDQWKTYVENRLDYILHRAATQVPYYRDYWVEQRRGGSKASLDQIENWPLLKKESLRANPRAFVADDRSPRELRGSHTSGTSGKPIDFWRSRQTETMIYALMEARMRRWNGLSRHKHWAILGGQQVIPSSVQRPPFWVWNRSLNQLYLSANHISAQNAPAYVAALKRYNITHLITYSSSAAFLARQLIEQGLSLENQLELVLTNAEPLYPWQRDVIAQGMGCPVRQTYGMGESIAHALEDDALQLRLWPDMGYVEVFADDADTPVPYNTTGRVIGTSLVNDDTLFIRYEIGDRCSLAAPSDAFKSPRQFPIISGIEGRISDMLVGRDGRRVFWLNPVFYGLPIFEAQIIQDTVDQIRIRYVPAQGFTAQVSETIVNRVHERMGDVEVILEPVDDIPKGANNKFKPVICNVAASMKT